MPLPSTRTLPREVVPTSTALVVGWPPAPASDATLVLDDEPPQALRVRTDAAVIARSAGIFMVFSSVFLPGDTTTRRPVVHADVCEAAEKPALSPGSAPGTR